MLWVEVPAYAGTTVVTPIEVPAYAGTTVVTPIEIPAYAGTTVVTPIEVPAFAGMTGFTPSLPFPHSRGKVFGGGGLDEYAQWVQLPGHVGNVDALPALQAIHHQVGQGGSRRLVENLDNPLGQGRAK